MKAIIEADAGDVLVDLTIDDGTRLVEAIRISGRGTFRMELRAIPNPGGWNRRWFLSTQEDGSDGSQREFADWRTFLNDAEMRSRRDILGRSCRALAELIGPDERLVQWDGTGLTGRIAATQQILRDFASDYGRHELTALLRTTLTKHGYEVHERPDKF